MSIERVVVNPDPRRGAHLRPGAVAVIALLIALGVFAAFAGRATVLERREAEREWVLR